MSGDRRLLDAVYQALNIPYPATIGDREVYDRVLQDRVMYARTALAAVLDDGTDADWMAGYLLGRLAQRPAIGYRAFGTTGGGEAR